jgi:hypothetical protein
MSESNSGRSMTDESGEPIELGYCAGWTTRASDGYVNALTLCRHHGKRWRDWIEADGTDQSPYSYPTTRLVAEHALVLDVPASELIRHEGGGVWVHPHLAEAVAGWACVKYAVASARAFDAAGYTADLVALLQGTPVSRAHRRPIRRTSTAVCVERERTST